MHAAAAAVRSLRHPPGPRDRHRLRPARLQYRLRTPLRYEITRHDSLFFLNPGSGSPQGTGRLVEVTVRPEGSRTVIVLDSVASIVGSQLAGSTIDSALGTRWETRISSSGLSGELRSNRSSILLGQIEAVLRLLFPQLPSSGVRSGDFWSDSSSYRIRLDAFEATESTARSSRAAVGAGQGDLRVEVEERVSRQGLATQGGRAMTLVGTGERHVTYDFSALGWVSSLRARDSLNLNVTIPEGTQSIPVLWRATIVARLRDTIPR